MLYYTIHKSCIAKRYNPWIWPLVPWRVFTIYPIQFIVGSLLGPKKDLPPLALAWGHLRHPVAPSEAVDLSDLPQWQLLEPSQIHLGAILAPLGPFLELLAACLCHHMLNLLTAYARLPHDIIWYHMVIWYCPQWGSLQNCSHITSVCCSFLFGPPALQYLCTSLILYQKGQAACGWRLILSRLWSHWNSSPAGHPWTDGQSGRKCVWHWYNDHFSAKLSASDASFQNQCRDLGSHISRVQSEVLTSDTLCPESPSFLQW